MNAPRMLSESEAWRLIAERLDEGYRRSSRSPFYSRSPDWPLCLCAQTEYLFLDGLIDNDYRLDERTFAHMDAMGNGGGYAWPRDEEHTNVRILAALLMSLEAADEERARAWPPHPVDYPMPTQRQWA